MLALISLYSCRETLVRLNDYLDRELSVREMRSVRRHLKICRHCTHKFAFETELVSEIRAKITRIDLPPDLMARISLRLSEPYPEHE